jgi:ABC-type nickel/cobalt efflux system permease component RcnA
MTAEITVLTLSAAAIAFVHTLLGPDHYLPFVAMARARGWNLRKTLKVTLFCGVGHLVGSIAIGLAGIFIGVQLSSLEWLEAARGNLAAWLLIGFGLAYTAWGLRQAYRNRPHRHWHSHGETTHSHVHSHHQEHAHLHEKSADSKSLTPWVIFIIFVLGPCEPLIPLLMYPAARESLSGVLMVSAVFGLVTVLTMIVVVFASVHGLKKLNFKRFERFGHAAAGSTVLACGLGVALLGL